jgi:hypothetical protein
MKISFLYSKIVVLKNCVRKFLFISSFRWYGDFFDDGNIFLNCLSELLFIFKISKIKKKPNTILKLTSLAMSCENLRKIGLNAQEHNSFENYRELFREKIEFEYYIFNVFLIAAKCILLNNSASFHHFSFKLGQRVELV